MMHNRQKRTRRTRRRLLLILLLLAVLAVEGGVLRSVLEQRKTDEDWRLVLVNATHPLTDTEAPELTELYNGVCVDSRIYPDLQAMFDDARAQGVDPYVREGYRTHQAQQEIMDSYIQRFLDQGNSRETAEALAREYVAEPGTSEHELGLAVDINARGDSDDWDVYNWLAEHAWDYGFILRYPDGKEDVTGITYEPWHYRYVGIEAALEIREQQVTLEEYLGETP